MFDDIMIGIFESKSAGATHTLPIYIYLYDLNLPTPHHREIATAPERASALTKGVRNGLVVLAFSLGIFIGCASSSIPCIRRPAAITIKLLSDAGARVPHSARLQFAMVAQTKANNDLMDCVL